MRPKKSVLLYCTCPVERCALSMSLRVWGYKVTRCGSSHHPRMECLGKGRFDLLLVSMTGALRGKPVPPELVPLFAEQEYRGDRVLLLDPDADAPTVVMASEPWQRMDGPMSEVRHAVQMAMRRKRGPKRYFVTAVAPVVPAQTAA